MELLVIEVLGVPQVLPHDRMVDQLKMHFLKRRNSGGDVLMVIYPLSTPGQAYVIFESAKVPGVLECTHILDVKNKYYPIRVKKADLSEVDMLVGTTLPLSLFPKQDSVRKLLVSYDFTITEHIPGRLQLKGSFLKLKLIRSQLIQLLKHEHHHHRPSSDHHNGSSLGYHLESNNPESRLLSKSILRNVHDMDAVGQRQLLVSAPPSSSSSSSSSSSYQVSGSVGSARIQQSCHSFYAGRNTSGPVDAVAEEYQRQDRSERFTHRLNSRADGASSVSANDPSGLNVLQQTSPSYRDLASGGFPRNLHSTQYSSPGSTSYAADTMRTHHTSHEDSDSGGSFRRRLSSDGSPSSLSGGISSFQVDTDILNFIQIKRQNDIQTIQKNYSTNMVVQGDAEIATVTFFGKNREKAKAYLLNIIKEISCLLRTQEIHLENYDPAKQMQILERIQRNQDSGVLITLRDDVIKLVGSSIESFEMIQKILGHKDDLSRGRAMERGSKVRRSSSLPRQYKMTHHSGITDPEPQASGTTKYNPAHYQEKPDEGKAPQIGRGSERTRSNAEYHDKNVATREQREYQDLELPSSSPGKKSQKNPFKKLIDSKLATLPMKLKDFHTKKQNQD